jgi:hypothetical protein
MTKRFINMESITNCMQIQRYLTKDKAKTEAFGEYFKENRWDFNWYIGDKKIGVTGNPSSEAECFMGGILVTDDELIITPSQKRPRIHRANRSYGVMRGTDGGLEEIGELVELIRRAEVTHMYLSSVKPEGYGEILTFSPTEPSKEFYKKGKMLPVSIDEDEVMEELELEQMLARIKRHR